MNSDSWNAFGASAHWASTATATVLHYYRPKEFPIALCGHLAEGLTLPQQTPIGQLCPECAEIAGKGPQP